MFVIQNVAKIFSHFMKKSFDNEGSGAAWVAEHQHHGLGFAHLWFYKSLEDWLKKETVIYSLIYFHHKVYA